jgi:RNA polymerase sigma-70 factor (ECF subfamily)
MGDRERVSYERGLRSAVLAGDEVAWRTWYDQHADDVSRYAQWRCGRANLAEDVVQETWLTVVKKIRSFDPGAGGFRGWVIGIASMIANNHVRKHVRQTQKQRTLVEVPAASNVAHDDDRSALTALAMTELNDRHEQVLRAKYFDGLAVNDIAANWNESPKAIESLLTRAREAFRENYSRLSNNNG